MSSCPSGVNDGQRGLIFKYPNREGHCEPCHHNCTQGWDRTQSVYFLVSIYGCVTKIKSICAEDDDVFMCYRCSGPGLNYCLEAARLAASRWVFPPAGEYKTWHCNMWDPLTHCDWRDGVANWSIEAPLVKTWQKQVLHLLMLQTAHLNLLYFTSLRAVWLNFCSPMRVSTIIFS